ncbi:MAG TPA: hypothetical protein VM911_05275 [Pyrinomonadaceae bacterium]|jgi:hypothetical protein|nr:hypothetical protein [Pyrinomonadaceae bacterium]
MNQAISVTLSNAGRWEEAFMVLSIERCEPFFAEMGLPPEVVANTQPLLLCARNFLNRSLALRSADSLDTQEYVETVRGYLHDAFDQIAEDYGQATADELALWCMRYVVDQAFAVKLDIWVHLFRRLCGLITDDELSIEPTIDQSVLTPTCEIVRRYLQPDPIKEARRRIEEAGRLPKSEWEEELDKSVRYSAGEGDIAGAVEIALTLVENIVYQHRAFRVLSELQNSLTEDETTALLDWARQQASMLGMRGDAVDFRPLP